VVELDGEQHALPQRRYDEARTERLTKAGFKTIRFGNADVLKNLDGVLEAIATALQQHPK
jgi:very-short-patch-repair endonuclease